MEFWGEIIKYERKLDKREIKVVSAGKNNIARIEILRNGDIIYSSNFDNWFLDIKFIDEQPIKNCYIESKILNRFLFYYVRVKCKSGSYAWASPIFIQG
ncbi:MAG: hypothetical protein NC915_05170 [Candidatus Omnitrophica bacterium]|nr:hypothetical protein [Candidatus Omnitrophota bacterium]